MTTEQLTPIFDGATDLPVRVGWYPSCPKPMRGAGAGNPHKWPRRYWNGRYFSLGACIGTTQDDEAYSKRTPSPYANDEFLWCGLTAPREEATR